MRAIVGVDRANDPVAFPPPWSVEDIGVAFVVKGSNDTGRSHLFITGMVSAVDPSQDPQCRQRIAAKIAKLPKLLGKTI